MIKVRQLQGKENATSIKIVVCLLECMTLPSSLLLGDIILNFRDDF
jgi:hypothetical protein